MVNVIKANDNNPKQLIITPNRAMSWNGILVLFSFIATVTISIGVWFCLNGMPYVLPYAGVEMFLLGWVLYKTSWDATAKEVIKFHGEILEIEKGHKLLENSYQFHQSWTNVILEMPDHQWHPSRLVIRSNGNALEIGKFLNEEERRSLASLILKELNDCVINKNY